MTDEDIARIRGRSPQARYLMRDGALTTEASHDMSRLLAEVERLRNREHASQVADRPQALEAAEREHDRWMAEHAALREIAQEVAFASTIAPSETRSYLVLHNPDKADALLAKARALLNPKVQPDL